MHRPYQGCEFTVQIFFKVEIRKKKKKKKKKPSVQYCSANFDHLLRQLRRKLFFISHFQNEQLRAKKKIR